MTNFDQDLQTRLDAIRAENLLRGLRARILTDGILRCGGQVG